MSSDKTSAFEHFGFEKTIALLLEEIRDLYQADQIPWVIGYSGGKDSTTVLQLVWMAIKALPSEKRQKQVYVISTDTLVENPVVAKWVTGSLEAITLAANAQGLPISAHQLTPKLSYRFWVNLLGKGYPSPRAKFRWCTERLKISPSGAFINNVVQQNGEAIMVLGSRKAESQARAKTMEKYEAKRIREKLSPNGSLPNSFVYTPVETWQNDDVWFYLLEVANPWGYDNKALFEMYKGATDSGECPFITDISSPSCGGSRFGCWVCTMVSKDRSMAAMIRNDEEKSWMQLLLDFRNELADQKDDRVLRDFRRMSGHVQLYNDKPIPGPYRQEVRERWLRRLLKIQLQAREEIKKHPALAGTNLELISMEELQEIRRIWVVEKHELEDSLPRIYKDVTGHDFPGSKYFDDSVEFGHEELRLLKEICGEDELHYQLTRELLSVERRYRTMAKRAGLFEELEKALTRGFYDNEEDALGRMLKRKNALESEREQRNLDIPAENIAEIQKNPEQLSLVSNN
jgi:DNA sulfur modification protein DndC